MRGKVLLYVLCCLSFVVRAQTVDLRFQQFDFNNTLSAYVINDLEQDAPGFIWIATNSGLFRFDGRDIKPYLNPDGKQYGIHETSVIQLYNDAKGRLWIGMNSHLAYYDLDSDSVITVANEAQPHGLQSAWVSRITEDQNNQLFVSQANDIYALQPDSLHFTLYYQLQGQDITDFFFDDQNQLWISGERSVYRIHTNNHHQQAEEMPVSTLLPAGAMIIDILLHKGNLWVLTLEHGVFACNLNEKSVQQYEYQPGGYNYARELYHDREGRLWLVTFSGLKMYVDDRDFFQGYYPSKDDEYTIKPNVSRVFQDRDLNYWTLHVPGGIGFSPRSNPISRFDSKTNSPFRLSSDHVTAVCEDASGNLWMGNAFNGIDVFEWAKGRTVTYHYQEGNAKSLGKGAILEIFRDSKDNMWVGSYWGGLQRFRPISGDFESFVHHEERNSISGNDVRSIAEDHEGNLWVCVHGKGVDRFDPVKGTWQNYNKENAQLANDFTFEIAFDTLGTAWVGTAWGLSSLAKGDSVFRTRRHNDSDPNSLSANLVQALYVDDINRVWAGTSNGLNLYLPETDGFRLYNAGLKNKQVVSISGDDSLLIWCGTSNGISRIDPETGSVLNMGRDHGFISNTFEARSVYNNGLGTLFFGTKDGINYFNTAEITSKDKAPKVVLTRLKILDREAVIGKDIDRNIVTAGKLTLKHNYKMLSLSFAALDYLEPEKHRYAYMLEGFDLDWNVVDNQNTVTFTNLKYGDYLFKVRASNREGVWTDEWTQLQILVKPPFWNLWYFHLLITILVTLLLYWIIVNRESRFRRVNALLEQKVMERTIDINRQNELLEKQKLELVKAGQVKDRFFSILAHDLRSPVYSLIQLTYLLKQKIGEGEPGNFETIVDKVALSAENTRNLLDDLLLWGNAHRGHVFLELTRIKALTLVMQSVDVYRTIAEEKKISIEILIPEEAEVEVDVNSMKVVFRNLLSNAIKFSYPKSVIEIKGKVKNDEVRISIIDYGVGMDKEQLSHIFDFGSKESTRGTKGEHGTGLGVILARELTEQNGGTIGVKSRKESGTRFTITLPLVKN
jgi:signal transduction histidine kinase/ligand-binding sensor domain-containing protein